MFLNRLQENEKIAFLKLAHHIARSDNDFSEEEQEIIQTYCSEMQIKDILFDERQFDIHETLNIFQDKHSQKIVVLEIMALVFSDDVLSKEEEELISIMTEHFGINETSITLYKEWTKAILALSRQGTLLLEL